MPPIRAISDIECLWDTKAKQVSKEHDDSEHCHDLDFAWAKRAFLGPTFFRSDLNMGDFRVGRIGQAYTRLQE